MVLDQTTQQWVYIDTWQPVSDAPCRPCGFCHLSNTPEGHDGCLGTLSNVMNACCGHGGSNEPFVQFSPAKRLSGKEALEWIYKNHPTLAPEDLNETS